MKKKEYSNPNFWKAFLFFLIIMAITPSVALSENTLYDSESDTIISANILTFEKLDLSYSTRFVYDGLVKSMFSLLQVAARQNQKDIETSLNLEQGNGFVLNHDSQFENNKLLAFENQSNIINDRLFKYFNMGEKDVFGSGQRQWTSSAKQMHKIDSDAFDAKLYIDVEYDEQSILKMNAITMKTQWVGTIINTTFYCQEKQFEMGISTKTINSLLPENIKVQLTANPQAEMAGIFFSIKL